MCGTDREGDAQGTSAHCGAWRGVCVCVGRNVWGRGGAVVKEGVCESAARLLSPWGKGTVGTHVVNIPRPRVRAVCVRSV